MDRVTATFNCGQCGAEQVFESDKMQPEAAVTCPGCGQVRTFGDIEAQMFDAIQSDLESLTREMFGKIK